MTDKQPTVPPIPAAVRVLVANGWRLHNQRSKSVVFWPAPTSIMVFLSGSGYRLSGSSYSLYINGCRARFVDVYNPTKGVESDEDSIFRPLNLEKDLEEFKRIARRLGTNS